MAVFGSGILNGLRITLRNMRRGPITLQYPHERNELPERARWAVELKLDEDGAHKCTSCQACVRACPDDVLYIDDTTHEDRSKHINQFQYELGACMMCGICVAACPFDAIEMGQNYELSTPDAAAMTYDFLTDVPAASAKRKPAAKVAGEGASARPARTPRPPRDGAAAPAGAEPVSPVAAAVTPERPVRAPRPRPTDGEPVAKPAVTEKPTVTVKPAVTEKPAATEEAPASDTNPSAQPGGLDA